MEGTEEERRREWPQKAQKAQKKREIFLCLLCFLWLSEFLLSLCFSVSSVSSVVPLVFFLGGSKVQSGFTK
jgi:hypothetical protein